MNSLHLPVAVADVASVLLPIDWIPPENPAEHPQCSPAAVLVVLFPGTEGLSFFLTGRPHTLSSHPGQISLPGGRAEPNDSSLLQTALRETEEELGIPMSSLTPLGRTETFHMFRSGYAISPFVAWSAGVPAVAPQPTEVEEVIEVPLAALLDPSSIHEENWEYNGQDWAVTSYRFGAHQVWGATARILDDLARRLGAPDSSHRFRPGDVRPVGGLTE